MTRVIAQNGDDWTLRKIRSLVDREAVVLEKQIGKIEGKIAAYEEQYGKLDDALYVRVDDMELLEWDGEVETMRRLREKLASLERIAFEHE
jgi:hypothetical protein